MQRSLKVGVERLTWSLSPEGGGRANRDVQQLLGRSNHGSFPASLGSPALFEEALLSLFSPLKQILLLLLTVTCNSDPERMSDWSWPWLPASKSWLLLSSQAGRSCRLWGLGLF